MRKEERSLFILTQTEPLNNNKTKEIYVNATKKEKELSEAGYRRYDRVYQITQENNDYIIICPEFRRSGKEDVERIVIIPEYLLPGRHYPVYIYLYAIDLYSRNSKMGQREAAAKTRNFFGLETFAHTTLGRALKDFVLKNDDVLKTKDEAGTCQQEKTASESEKACGAEKTVVKSPNIPSIDATAENRRRALLLLEQKNISTEDRKQAIENSLFLVVDYFLRYCRILL